MKMNINIVFGLEIVSFTLREISFCGRDLRKS